MPTRARRRCTASGCPDWATHDGRCQRHHIPRPKPKGKPRPSSSALGYTYAWRKKSESYRKRHPWCEAPGCGQRSAATDHIDGDNTNWEEDNLQALCWPHHSTKTAKHDGGFGNTKTIR